MQTMAVSPVSSRATSTWQRTVLQGVAAIAATSGMMSFLDHLDELRRRLIWAVAAVGVGFAVTFPFVDEIFAFIMRPMQRLLPAGQTLIYTDPSEAFMLEIKIAIIAGLIVASPMVFTQLWLFIAPGLYSHEKK